MTDVNNRTVIQGTCAATAMKFTLLSKMLLKTLVMCLAFHTFIPETDSAEITFFGPVFSKLKKNIHNTKHFIFVKAFLRLPLSTDIFRRFTFVLFGVC